MSDANVEPWTGNVIDKWALDLRDIHDALDELLDSGELTAAQTQVVRYASRKALDASMALIGDVLPDDLAAQLRDRDVALLEELRDAIDESVTDAYHATGHPGADLHRDAKPFNEAFGDWLRDLWHAMNNKVASR